MTYKFTEQHILHYRNMLSVDDDTVNAMYEPLIVINSDEENKHIQIKVTPFNQNNQDKNLLSFADKIQYFKKKIRRSIIGDKAVVENEVLPNTNVTLVHLVNSYNFVDGIDDELNEFLDGLNNGGDTGGYDDNIIGFCATYFLDLHIDSLTEFSNSINNGY